MAKLICYMRNGFSFCHPRTGLKVPATAAAIEVNDWQERNLREDPRVIVLEAMPTPALPADEEQLAEVVERDELGAATVVEVKAKPPAGKKRKAGRRG